MGQINITRGNSFQIPPTNALGLSYNDTGDLIKINADGSSTILIQGTSESVSNILANAGVGLEAGLPASPTQGDIYVTTDTLKVFTVIGVSSWNQTDLSNKQFVTDTSGTSWILYQYNGTELKVVGTDDKVRVSATDTTNDYLNAKLTVGDEFTKEIANPAANEALLLKFKGWIYNVARTFKAIVSSANLTADRTFTWPDITGLIAVFGMTNPFAFGGQVSGGYSIETFSSTKTFNLNNGNSQEMTLTSNIITLTLSNKVNGGSYLIYLVQDTTGSRTIPTPDSTWGVRTDNSADFVTSANAVNLINVNVRPNGTTYYTIETYTP